MGIWLDMFTNARAMWLADASGNQITTFGAPQGTAGAPNSSVTTVQGVAGGTAVITKALQETYTLASAASLTAQAGTSASPTAGSTSAPIIMNTSAAYGWSYIFSGTTPSIKLQSLGADGTTWQDVDTVTASGAKGITIFAGANGSTVRLFNNSANAVTGLTSTLSN